MGYKREIVNGNKIVRFLFNQMDRRKISIKYVSTKAGYGGGTISNWRYKTMPTIDSIEDCLNVIGYTLKPVPKDD